MANCPGFPGTEALSRTFSAKIGKVLDKLGWLVNTQYLSDPCYSDHLPGNQLGVISRADCRGRKAELFYVLGEGRGGKGSGVVVIQKS